MSRKRSISEFDIASRYHRLLLKAKRQNQEALRKAFVEGAYWGMDNPFGPDTDIPQSEAERRFPDK